MWNGDRCSPHSYCRCEVRPLLPRRGQTPDTTSSRSDVQCTERYCIHTIQARHDERAIKINGTKLHSHRNAISLLIQLSAFCLPLSLAWTTDLQTCPTRGRRLSLKCGRPCAAGRRVAPEERREETQLRSSSPPRRIESDRKFPHRLCDYRNFSPSYYLVLSKRLKCLSRSQDRYRL